MVPRGTIPKDGSIWSQDAERAVLAAILIANDPAHRISTELATRLSADMFYRSGHRAIYAAMQRLRAAAVVVDPLTLAHELESAGQLGAAGGKEFIGGLFDEIPTTEHAAAHAEIIRDRWQRRELVHLGMSIKRLASDPSAAIADAFSYATKALAPLAAGTLDQGFEHIKASMVATLEQMEDRSAGRAPVGLTTGMPELDDRLQGGIEFGELVAVCGVPSCGKTSFVFQILTDLAVRGVCATAFVSAEMKKGMLNQTALAGHARVAREHIKTGQLTDRERRDVYAAAARLIGAPIYLSDEVMPDIEDVVNRCRLLKAQDSSLGAIGVDFFQLVGHRERGRGDLQAATLSYIAYRLKAIALELSVVMFVLAQPNDKQVEDRGEDKRPQLRDIQGSSGLRQAAENIWLLYRPGQYSPAAGPGFEINLAKNKFGPVGTVSLVWEGATVRVASPRREQLELQAKRDRERPLSLIEGDH